MLPPVTACPQCGGQTPTCSANDGELTCPQCASRFPLPLAGAIELPAIVSNSQLLDRVGAGREADYRRRIIRETSNEAAQSALGGPWWWATGMGGIGGVAIIVAAFLPVVRIPESRHFRADPRNAWHGETVIVPAHNLHFWELPVKGSLSGAMATAMCAGLGAAATVLAVSRLFAGLWLPGIGSLAFASYWHVSVVQQPQLTVLASTWVVFVGGVAIVVAALGGSRRGNANVLAGVSLLAWWVPLFGCPIAMGGLFFSTLAAIDAHRGVVKARATGDSRRISAATRLRTAPFVALAASALGMLLTFGTFVWFALQSVLSR